MMLRAGGFFGAAALGRPALADPARPQLVGITAAAPIPEGAMLLPQAGALPQGYVTSAGLRILGDGAVALGLLDSGRARHGETLVASSPTRGQTVAVRVTAPMFHDASGARYND
jgi:sarcosine oxidase subunit alpha